MFLLRRPTTTDIQHFLERSRELPLSYGPIGIVGKATYARRLDEHVAIVGHGRAGFERARGALRAWKHFAIGWVECFPENDAIEPGTVVAVLIRHLGFWSLNGARVLYVIEGTDGAAVFGFAYGTLTNHAESGEELFEVFVNRETGDIVYRIRAVSWPQSPLAWLGQPIVRRLQRRFRNDSATAMKRATSGR